MAWLASLSIPRSGSAEDEISEAAVTEAAIEEASAETASGAVASAGPARTDELAFALDNVTLFTASDFARTLGSNSNSGSDHAWGSNQIVTGGAQVNGGYVHGFYPDMTNKQDFLNNWSTDSRGRLLPSHSVDEYMAGIFNWFGVPASDLPTVLPNLANFSSNPYGSLDFMA